MAYKRCEHYYWRTLPPHRGNYAKRWCTFCGQKQYRINGEWEKELTLEQFSQKWVKLGSTRYEEQLRIEVAYMFEWRCYESWNLAYKIVFDGIEYGPYDNLNEAYHKMKAETENNFE